MFRVILDVFLARLESDGSSSLNSGDLYVVVGAKALLYQAR